MKMKIAINKCYGGFSVSHEVAVKLREKGHPITLKGELYSDGSGPAIGYCYHLKNDDFKDIPDAGNNGFIEGFHNHRAHPDLIEAIETTENPNGRFSNIRIVDIPDDVEWEIDEYDGIETVRELHRSW